MSDSFKQRACWMSGTRVSLRSEEQEFRVSQLGKARVFGQGLLGGRGDGV